MHIHIIGIAGTMTSALAFELKKQGYIITGSDQERIYPPVSNFLESAGISINSQLINQDIDLVIVGPSFDNFQNTRTEYEETIKQKIPYKTSTQYIAELFDSNNAIQVAGTYGKTTITSLLAWIFLKTQKDPSYMFGGLPINYFVPLKLGKGDFSILEADESINGLDEMAKFHYYPLKHLILTSAEWEHKDSYESSSQNFDSFKNLIERIPQEGILVANAKGESVEKLTSYCHGKVVTYNSSGSKYKIISTSSDKNGETNLNITTPQGNYTLFTTLIGTYNYDNILAAVTMSLELGLDPKQVIEAVASFQGIKRRLEILPSNNGVLFIDDFAQSATRIESALNAVKLQFPNRSLKIFLEPHASSLKQKVGLIGLGQALKPANEVILSAINFDPKVSKLNRTTATNFKDEIGTKLTYLPIYQDILIHYQQTLKEGDILLHFSSGGLEGLNILKKLANSDINYSLNQPHV